MRVVDASQVINFKGIEFHVTCLPCSIAQALENGFDTHTGEAYKAQTMYKGKSISGYGCDRYDALNTLQQNVLEAINNDQRRNQS